jgi:hypothetical protein
MLNGNAWAAATREAKLMYIRGIEEGLVLGGSSPSSRIRTGC